jgi:hypothetical protein
MTAFPVWIIRTKLTPHSTGIKLDFFAVFMIVFHDSPADVDPQKLRKEVKRSGAYCPPFELPGGVG